MSALLSAAKPAEQTSQSKRAGTAWTADYVESSCPASLPPLFPSQLVNITIVALSVLCGNCLFPPLRSLHTDSEP
jgi:hypothetical protein